jgi:alpha-ketoglutarate-dependent taurine dioxygenase
VAALRAALDEHGVLLLLRGQKLDPDAQIAFSRRFGALQEVAQKQYQMAGKPEIYIIGNVEENGRAIGDPSVGRLWHSDHSFLQYRRSARCSTASSVPKKGRTPSSPTCTRRTRRCRQGCGGGSSTCTRRTASPSTTRRCATAIRRNRR